MIDYSRLAFRIEPMTVRDIPAIMEIEVASFSAPWSVRAYDYEVRYNDMAHYIVARPQGQSSGEGVPPIVAAPTKFPSAGKWRSRILAPCAEFCSARMIFLKETAVQC